MLKYLESQFYYPFSLSAGAFKEITESLATCGGLILWDKTKPNSESESKRKPFGTVPGNFSEYQYFLPHVRQLLFKGDDPALRVFEVDPKAIEGWSIVVKIPPRVGTAPLERRARLRWVMVMIYDLDVAVLSFAVRSNRCERLDPRRRRRREQPRAPVLAVHAGP
jgi:hypothetical protein